MPGLSPFFLSLVKCPGPVVQTRARGPLFEIPPGQVGQVQGGARPGQSGTAAAAAAAARSVGPWPLLCLLLLKGPRHGRVGCVCPVSCRPGRRRGLHGGMPCCRWPAAHGGHRTRSAQHGARAPTPGQHSVRRHPRGQGCDCASVDWCVTGRPRPLSPVRLIGARPAARHGRRRLGLGLGLGGCAGGRCWPPRPPAVNFNFERIRRARGVDVVLGCRWRRCVLRGGGAGGGPRADRLRARALRPGRKRRRRPHDPAASSGAWLACVAPPRQARFALPRGCSGPVRTQPVFHSGVQAVACTHAGGVTRCAACTRVRPAQQACVRVRGPQGRPRFAQAQRWPALARARGRNTPSTGSRSMMQTVAASRRSSCLPVNRWCEERPEQNPPRDSCSHRTAQSRKGQRS